jgi:hypothetical protein
MIYTEYNEIFQGFSLGRIYALKSEIELSSDDPQADVYK